MGMENMVGMEGRVIMVELVMTVPLDVGVRTELKGRAAAVELLGMVGWVDGLVEREGMALGDHRVELVGWVGPAGRVGREG